MAVNVYIWLKTFRNQRHLAHQASILSSLAMLALGSGSFVMSGLDNGRSSGRIPLAWMTAALGMLALAANSMFYISVSKLESLDPLATEESSTISRTTVTVVGAFVLIMLSGAEFALSRTTDAAGFVAIPIVAAIAGTVGIITIAYDVLYLCRPNAISLDEATNVPLEYDEFDP